MKADRRSPRPPQAVDENRGDEERAGQHARQLRRKGRETQPVLQHGNREQAGERAPQRAAAAEYRRAPEDDCRNGVELVAGAGVRFRLAEMRDVDDGGQARHHSREHIHERDAPCDRYPGVSRAGSREAYRVQRAADN